MQTKNLTVTDMDTKGKGLALIADLNEIDHDGDGYEEGAFSWKEQWAPLLTQHYRIAVPFGKARIYEQDQKAWAELHFNMDIGPGKEWHSALMFDLETGNPVQEWSYGYDPLEAEKVMRGLQAGRTLKKVDVHEVSTVVRGAGRGTRTIDVKAIKAAMKAGEFDQLIGQLGEMEQVLRGDPGLLSATGRKQLEQIHAALGEALVDPAEEEAKAREAIEAELVRFETLDARLKIKAS